MIDGRSMIVVQGKEDQLEVCWVRGLKKGKKESLNELGWIDQT